MSSLKKGMIAGLLLIAGVLVLGGCGSKPNDNNSVFSDQTGHPAGWLPAGHMTAAQADESVCAECHGDDYAGGTSGVSCTQCHLGGVNAIHPVSWGTGSQIDQNHAPYAQANGAASCANAACHGTNLGGVAGSGPACTSCHVGNALSEHPSSWGTGSQIDLNHGPYVQVNGTTACANAACHGTNLGGAAGSGPACSACHVNTSPFPLAGCISCHGKPPAGTVAPNRSGAHAAHNALPNVTNICTTCHNGAGSGTLKHNTGVVYVAFPNTTYDAKSGKATGNADGTCSNVSCHGGQTTPGWYTGSIDVNSQCSACHVSGTSQYNSYFSGQHVYHISNWNIACTQCHDTTLLAANHFTSLNTTAFSVPASATIRADLNYAGGTCLPSCHLVRSW